MSIGLTGGIATGKSTVSALFRELGASILDADVAARKVVEPGTSALEEIRAVFGEQALLPTGELNRPWLGSQVFGNAGLLEQLNQIVHPRVREYMLSQIQEQEARPAAVVIVDVPLLFEVGLYPGMTESILVYAPYDVQLERLMKRNNLTTEQAQLRISSQMDIERKRELATYSIDNSGSLADTITQVEALWRLLQGTAEGRPDTKS
ncbi:MAG: dephospho-CoA kinase [Bacilli bacterium]|nr:dephospho-CoA kinase [Bacilli bacterium]